MSPTAEHSGLKARLNDAVKAAMRARETGRLSTLRLVQAAVRQLEIDERRELGDREIMGVIEKQVKQRRESVAAYRQAGRTELADKEQAEIAVLQEFLPRPADEAEIAQAVQAAVQEVREQGLSGGAAMGRAMGILKTRLAGRADMAGVSARVKSALG